MDINEHYRKARNFCAGYCSGVALVLVGHPFDTIKVRLQTEGTKGKFNGLVDCIKTTIVNEGVRGLYKGLMAPLLATGIINSILFGIQFNILQAMTLHREGQLGIHLSSSELRNKATLGDTCIAAVISGGIISLLVAPMEGVKARLQLQYSNAGAKYLGPIDCAKKVYKELGLRGGIYRGWLPVCLCRMSNYSYFGAYAAITHQMRETMKLEKDEKLHIGASLVAGGLSGICYWLSCYPIDVIKNRMQGAPDVYPPKYRGFLHAIRTIYATEGWRAFFAGFTPCAMRAFPANAAAFVGFELALRVLPEKLPFLNAN